MLGLKQLISDKKHVIWDWNGTLLNDIDLAVDCISSILTENGLEAITREEYRKTFRFPVIEYYKGLGFDFERTPFEDVAKAFIDRFNRGVPQCPLFDEAHQLLTEVKESGVEMSVLSAAQQSDLEFGLTQHEIDGHFEHIFGIADRLAASKVSRGQQLLEALNQKGVSPRDIVMFGDTDHDLEVATELGIDMVLLGDGHQCADRLASVKPDVIRCRYTDQRVQ